MRGVDKGGEECGRCMEDGGSRGMFQSILIYG